RTHPHSPSPSLIPPHSTVPLTPTFTVSLRATTEPYTLSLHDALPILGHTGESSDPEHTPYLQPHGRLVGPRRPPLTLTSREVVGDRKSTRLNSSHGSISYAVFCLKKKIEARAINLRLSAGTSGFVGCT